jgi:hypothetical protein
MIVAGTRLADRYCFRDGHWSTPEKAATIAKAVQGDEATYGLIALPMRPILVMSCSLLLLLQDCAVPDGASRYDWECGVSAARVIESKCAGTRRVQINPADANAAGPWQNALEYLSRGAECTIPAPGRENMWWSPNEKY